MAKKYRKDIFERDLPESLEEKEEMGACKLIFLLFGLFARLCGYMAYLLILFLAFIGLVALLYPEIRMVLLFVLSQAYKDFLFLISRN